MTTTRIARTSPHMTHIAIVDAAGELVGLACSTRKLPKSAKLDAAEHVVCNRCTGAHRSGTRLG